MPDLCVQPQWVISWCFILTACPVSQPPTLSLSLFVLLLRGCVIYGAWYTLWPEQECCKMPPQNMAIWHSDEEWGMVSQWLTACLSVLCVFVYVLAQSLSFCSERFFIWHLASMQHAALETSYAAAVGCFCFHLVFCTACDFHWRWKLEAERECEWQYLDWTCKML